MRAGRTAKRIRQEAAAKRQAAHEEATTKNNPQKARKGETNDQRNEGRRESPMP